MVEKNKRKKKRKGSEWWNEEIRRIIDKERYFIVMEGYRNRE